LENVRDALADPGYRRWGGLATAKLSLSSIGLDYTVPIVDQRNLP
jgi:hypothetical protein